MTNREWLAGLSDKQLAKWICKKKMTNREWVNSLSDAQLVKLLHAFHQDNCCMCADTGKDDCGFCYDKQVEWMKQEHDAERWEELDYRYSFW